MIKTYFDDHTLYELENGHYITVQINTYGETDYTIFDAEGALFDGGALADATIADIINLHFDKPVIYKLTDTEFKERFLTKNF